MNGTIEAREPATRLEARTGVDLVKATKEFAREERWRSWWHLGSTLCVLVAAFAATTLPIHWLPRLALSVLTGLTLVRTFVIYHDHAHGTILGRSRLASAFFYVFGVLSLNPPSSWKASHNYHHQNNAKIFGSSIGSFPVMTTDGYERATRLERLAYAFSRHPLTLLLGYISVFFYSMTLKSLLQEPKRHLDCAIAFVAHIAILVVLGIFAPAVLLFAVIIPLASASALGAYLFYSQHNFPGVELRPRAEWEHVHAALRSSSYTAMNPVLQWFTGNIGFHHVHHLNAKIPFYRLPEAMRSIPELQAITPLRLTPADIYRCLRLKLWDPARNRMVSFRGA